MSTAYRLSTLQHFHCRHALGFPAVEVDVTCFLRVTKERQNLLNLLYKADIEVSNPMAV